MKSVYLILLIFALGVLTFLGCSSSEPAETSGPAAAPEKKNPEPAKPEVPRRVSAVIATTAGDLHCTLFGDKAPNAVANFIALAEGTKTWIHPASGAVKRGIPLYDGTTFHRTIPDFMIQGGDPKADGTGKPGFTFDDEFDPSLKFDRPGRLAMANTGPNTNGSDFFITEVATPQLDYCDDPAGCTRGGREVRKGYGYTIFGQCDEATVARVRQIARRPVNSEFRPRDPVRIKHVTIIREEGEGSQPREAK